MTKDDAAETHHLASCTGGSNSLSLLTFIQTIGTRSRLSGFQLKPDTFVKVWTQGDLFI